jgi:cell wall-associated NlpC family hydrolase
VQPAVANPARRITRHRAGALVTALAATLGLLLGNATAAHASPSATDIENQIDKEWRSLEPTIENYDAVHEQLQHQQVTAAALEAKIEPLQLQVKVQLAKVGGIAANVYKAGPIGTMSTLLNAESSTEALNMLGEIEQLATSQRAQVAGALKLQKRYEAQAKPVDALVASLKSRQRALNQQKIDIQKKINSLNAQRMKAFGTTRAAGSLRPVACPQVYTGDAGSRAARYACAQIGKPYIWDAAGPGSFDCSGLVLAAWRTLGVSMPHNAYAQAHTFRSVSSGALKPGDLVFYYHPISHVTIYVGHGWVVSAPQTGDVVRMKKMNATPPSGYVRP